jgi:hypothetical protein
MQSCSKLYGRRLCITSIDQSMLPTSCHRENACPFSHGDVGVDWTVARTMHCRNNIDFTLCWNEPNEFLVGSSRTACNLKRLPTILLRAGRNRNYIEGTAYILALFLSFCGPFDHRHAMIGWPNFQRILLGQSGMLSVHQL